MTSERCSRRFRPVIFPRAATPFKSDPLNSFHFVQFHSRHQNPVSLHRNAVVRHKELTLGIRAPKGAGSGSVSGRLGPTLALGGNLKAPFGARMLPPHILATPN